MDHFRWAQAVVCFHNKQYERSKLKLLSISGNRRFSSEYFALLATINLIQGEFSDVRNLLEIAIDDSTPTRSSYREYIDYYCRYYLSFLEGDEAGKVKNLEGALRVRSPAIIRNWLPLS